MNADQLQKNVGQTLRLRPQPRVVRSTSPTVSALTSDGPRYVKDMVNTDYNWVLTDVSPTGVTLHCEFTRHTVTLGADNVREFRTPNFLMLKGQLILDGDAWRFEPA